MSTCAITTALAVAMTQATPAGAANGKVRQGWWTAANAAGPTPGATPGALPGPIPGPVPDPVPDSVIGPDVPSDGLLVQGGPSESEPVAIAALVVPLAADAAPIYVVLHLAEKGNTVAGSTLKACVLKSPDFEPVQGGSMTEAPAYDCANAVAIAPAGDDGKTFTFEAGPLVVGRAVAVAFVAGTPQSRVVLAKPGDDVVTFLNASGGAGGFGMGGLPPGGGYVGTGSIGALPATGPLPAIPVSAAPATPAPRGGDTALPAAFAVPIDPSANGAAVLGALFALSVAAGAWRLAGNRRPRRVGVGSPAGAQA